MSDTVWENQSPSYEGVHEPHQADSPQISAVFPRGNWGSKAASTFKGREGEVNGHCSQSACGEGSAAREATTTRCRSRAARTMH